MCAVANCYSADGAGCRATRIAASHSHTPLPGYAAVCVAHFVISQPQGLLRDPLHKQAQPARPYSLPQLLEALFLLLPTVYLPISIFLLSVTRLIRPECSAVTDRLSYQTACRPAIAWLSFCLHVHTSLYRTRSYGTITYVCMGQTKLSSSTSPWVKSM